jgi:hypothetical protein
VFITSGWPFHAYAVFLLTWTEAREQSCLLNDILLREQFHALLAVEAGRVKPSTALTILEEYLGKWMQGAHINCIHRYDPLSSCLLPSYFFVQV